MKQFTKIQRQRAGLGRRIYSIHVLNLHCKIEFVGFSLKTQENILGANRPTHFYKNPGFLKHLII